MVLGSQNVYKSQVNVAGTRFKTRKIDKGMSGCMKKSGNIVGKMPQLMGVRKKSGNYFRYRPTINTT